MFVPKGNIKEFSTDEHPGLATIYEAGRGQDIKGILKEPIRIGDYRLPWEFQTSLVQSFNLTAGVGAKTQVNAAIGLNVAVTFSDPSTWPADRTKRPPKTHEFQLLVVHLGCTGEAGVGLPQFSTEPHPETYLVWGRGDLGHTVMGDWRDPLRLDRRRGQVCRARQPAAFLSLRLAEPDALGRRHQVRCLARLEHADHRLLGIRARSPASGRSGRSSRPIAGSPTCSAAICRRSRGRIRCFSATGIPRTTVRR